MSRSSSHTEEFKVRLTESDADLLQVLAARRDVPPAVFCRAILVDALRALQGSVAPAARNGRGAEGLR